MVVFPLFAVRAKLHRKKTVENPEEIDIDNVEEEQEDGNQGNGIETRQQNGQGQHVEDDMMVS